MKEFKSSNNSASHSAQTKDYLIRLPELLALTSKSRSTLYREISNGTFPAPVRIGARAVAWRASDITEWLESLKRTTESEGGIANELL